MDIDPSSVRLSFAQAGEGLMRSGFVHRKTVSSIIIAQAVEGSYDIECIGGPSAKLKTGEAFLTAPGVPLVITHNGDPLTGRFLARWIHFNFSVFDAVGLASLVEFPPGIEKPWADRIGALSGTMLAAQRGNDAKSFATAAKINAISFEILVILLDFLASKGLYPELSPDTERLLPALEYARRNLSHRIYVGDMANKAGLSVPRFHVEFKRLLGDTPLEHLRKLRLSKAGDLLRGTGKTLEDIASETGFCNQFHFSREFSKAYGEPPSVYRRTMRGGLVF